MSKLRSSKRGKARKQISLSPDVVPLGMTLAKSDCRSFSNLLEYLIRSEHARRNSEVAAV
jgi:hypothetical protein